MDTKFFIVNGYPQSGKTTFENFIINDPTIRGQIVSIINNVRSAAQLLGWDGEKDRRGRDFLAKLLQIAQNYSNRYLDTFIEETVEYARTFNYDVVFMDVRNPSNIRTICDRMKDKYGIDVTTVYIDREGVTSASASNPEDNNVERYRYDVKILNNGSLEVLKTTAETFLKNFIIK